MLRQGYLGSDPQFHPSFPHLCKEGSSNAMAVRFLLHGGECRILKKCIGLFFCRI
eukprot:c6324_g1_i1 orf=222-386(+)